MMASRLCRAPAAAAATWMRLPRQQRRFLSSTLSSASSSASSSCAELSVEEQAKVDKANAVLQHKVERGALVRHLRKNDIALESEPLATVERLLGNLGEERIARGTSFQRHIELLEAAEASGDGSELVAAVEKMSSKEKLLFYAHKEHWENRAKKVDHSELSKISDSDMKEVMDAAVIKFRQLGKQLQKLDEVKEEKRQERLRRVRTSESQDSEQEKKEIEIQGQRSSMDIYSTKTDITEVDQSDMGKYFELSEDDLALLPEGLAGSIGEEFETTSVRKLMLRKPMLRIIDRLRDLESATTPARDSIFIGGAYGGCGKSAALSTAALFARKSGWFVLYVPKADRVSSSGYRMLESQTKPGFFVQPGLQHELFSEIAQTSASALKKIKLKRKYESTAKLGFRCDSEKESTLYDLVLFCANDQLDESGEAVFDFFAELELVDEVNVMIAVDGVNVWDRNSAYWDFTKEKLPPLPASQLALVDGMQKYQLPEQNGVGMFSMTSMFAAPGSNEMRRRNMSLVTMLPYSSSEFETVLEHWIRSRILYDESAGSKAFSDMISALSRRVPKEVSRVISYL